MFKGVKDIEDHVYVRAILSARRHGRAVDNAECGAHEEGPKPSVHCRIEVAGSHEYFTSRAFGHILYDLPHIVLHPP